jgi:ATP-dependent protease Clp ATPase subunit
MFDLPGRKDVVKCTVTAAAVRKEEQPELTMRKTTRTRRAS